MKSLEIVNREILFCKEEIKEMKHIENIEDNEYYLYIKECLKEQEQIKQDLEVLEILRKHLRFMGENKTSLKLVNNGCVSNDLVKVKQWLEVNEQ